MNLSNKIFIRTVRARRRVRAWRLGRRLKLVQDNTKQMDHDGVTAFVTVYNEKHRLAYFLEYYRNMGVKHFIFIDNNSSDGTAEFLADEPDVTRYWTDQSYRRAHFGMDWVNWLLLRHARGRWALTVDVDEFLVYPHCDKRPLTALTDWLDASSLRFMPAQLLDLYPVRKLKQVKLDEDTNPFQLLTHFDVGNYSFKKNTIFQNLWIQGGVRARLFFANRPENAPALNKSPLVKWKRGYVYTSSTHQLLPRSLNHSYSRDVSERLCGALLHTKFMPDLRNKVRDPYLLSQHYSSAREYHSYNQVQLDDLKFVSKNSVRYQGWQQLEQLGIIAQGGWA